MGLCLFSPECLMFCDRVGPSDVLVGNSADTLTLPKRDTQEGGG